MLAVSVIWIVLLVIFLALGDVIFLLLNHKKDNLGTQSISATFFIGLAIACSIACGISIFTPLTSSLFFGLISASVIYWVLFHKRLRKLITLSVRLFIDTPIWKKAIFLFFGFVTLYHSASFSSSFDQFLYHQQHIKWLQEYGTVNGLANLHTRFGFNSSSLSIVSLFAYHPDLKISFTALNGLSVFIFASRLILRMTKSRHIVIGFIYAATLVVFCHFYAMELSSTSTDILVNVIIAYLLLICLDGEKVEDFILPLAILPVFCITLKLSAAPIIIVSLYAYYHLIISKKTKMMLYPLIISFFIGLFWLVQNVILTGYLIFPFPSIDLFSFDWKVPSDIVIAEQTTTYNWARGVMHTDGITSNWIIPWWLNQPLMDKVVYLLALSSIILSIICIKKIIKNGLFTVGYITAIGGALFGFLTAPALRFSLGFTLLLFFFTIYLLHNSSKKTAPDFMVKIAQYAFIGAFAIFHTYYIGNKAFEKLNMGKEYLMAQYIKPFPLHYAALNAKFDSIKINNIEIYIPLQQGSCYDHKLPCAPSVNNNLELRGEDISKGFKIRQK